MAGIMPRNSNHHGRSLASKPAASAPHAATRNQAGPRHAPLLLSAAVTACAAERMALNPWSVSTSWRTPTADRPIAPARGTRSSVHAAT
eukprot:scaffold47240_cov63-Phaeocystis_antarctica.AAC.3